MPFSDDEYGFFLDLQSVVRALRENHGSMSVEGLEAAFKAERPRAESGRLMEILERLQMAVKINGGLVSLITGRRSLRGASTRGKVYGDEEARLVVAAYPYVRNQIHERSDGVIALAAMLSRPIRSVENQLLMCRFMERREYGRSHSAGVIREAWSKYSVHQSDASTPISVTPETPLNANAEVSCAFQDIQRLSFGGEDVAAMPSASDSCWPRANGTAGADEMLQYVVERLRTRQGPVWVFLLGSAGNGKSAWVGRLAAELNVSWPSEARARRTYEVPEWSLVLLNDATIVGDSYANPAKALGDDMRSWLEKPKIPSSVICANRGIITGEVRSHGGEPGAVSDILSWLEDGRLGGAVRDACSGSEAFHYRRALLEPRSGEGNLIELHALSVDAHSLFQQRIPRSLGLRSHPGQQAAPQEETAGFIREVDGRLEATSFVRPLWCPLRANVQTFGIKSCLDSFMSLVRATELVSGQNVTYRDLWGLLSMALAGPRRIRRQGQDSTPENWVDREAASGGDCLERRWKAMMRLASARAHVALLGLPVAGIPREPHPVADSPTMWDASRGGDAGRVFEIEEAVSGVEFGKCPSMVLWPCEGQAYAAGWTSFDLEVEKAGVAYVMASAEDPDKRRAVRRWLARYHLAFATVFQRCHAHREVVEAMERALDKSFTNDFSAALGRLINGTHGEGGILLPAFGPVVRPVGKAEPSKLEEVAVEFMTTEMKFQRVVRDGRVWVELRDLQGALVTDSQLDFRMAREVMALKDGGITEQGPSLAPRLERARAALLREKFISGEPTFRIRVGEVWI